MSGFDFARVFDSVTKDGKPYESIALTDETKALLPELANFRFAKFYLQPEERKSENSPTAIIKAFIPRPKEEEKTQDKIPY